MTFFVTMLVSVELIKAKIKKLLKQPNDSVKLKVKYKLVFTVHTFVHWAPDNSVHNSHEPQSMSLTGNHSPFPGLQMR